MNLAARHRDGNWILVYLAAKASFSVDMEKLTAGERAKAFWIDPRTGESVSLGSLSTGGVKPFSTPEGWEDALLVLETAGG